MHEGIRYPCDQCDYVATQPRDLTLHIEGDHEGVRYPCDKCEYTATRPLNLKRHKKRKHEGKNHLMVPNSLGSSGSLVRMPTCQELMSMSMSNVNMLPVSSSMFNDSD